MNRYISLLICLMTIFMVSCKNFLDIDQPDIVEKEQNFQDLQTVRSSVMGIYSTFAKTVESLFLAGEVRADLVNATPNANNYIREFENNTFSGTNPYISSKPFYNIVVNSNEILNQLDKTLVNGSIDTLEYQSLRGELLGMRSWANLQMLKMFGKCKFIETPMDNYPEQNLAYLSKDETLDKIITDLQEADTLKVGLGVAEWERVRVSRFYINVLLGEAYLERGMFEEAAAKFFEVIRKGDDQFQSPGKYVDYAQKFKVNSKFGNNNWANLFKKNWVGLGASEEYLFYIGFSEQYDQRNNLQNWTTSVNGTYQVRPSNGIIGQLNKFDDPYRGMGVSIKKESNDNIIINKYNMDRAAGIGDAGLIVNRAARIHLLYAECMNRLGATDTALMIVNNGLNLTNGFATLGVRGRVSLPAIEPDSTLAGDNITNWVEDLILDEMGRETAFEGNRWFDLVRIATRRNDPSILADRVASKFPLAIREKQWEKFMDTSKWYLPSAN